MNTVCAAIIKVIAGAAIAISVAPMVLGYSLLHAEPTQIRKIETGADLMLMHKNEGQIDERVNDFFARFERANASSDVSKISGLYADTFMFGGPIGVQVVKKEDFLKVLPKMKAHFSSMGLSATQLQAVKTTPLGSKYLLANVVWRMKLRNSSRNNHVDALASYVLVRENGDALSIVVQIDHQDLASVIKEQQNTQR